MKLNGKKQWIVELSVAAFMVSTVAGKAAVTMTFSETPSGVTLVCSGSINLGHFILLGDGAYYSGVKPSDGYAKSGGGEDGVWILDLARVGPVLETGSLSFGSSSTYSTPTIVSGPTVGIRTFAETRTIGAGSPYFFTPFWGQATGPGGESATGGPFADATSTWSSATFTSLGLEIGTYTISWGSGADADSWTVAVVPEPSAALLSLVGVGAALSRRRRS